MSKPATEYLNLDHTSAFKTLQSLGKKRILPSFPSRSIHQYVIHNSPLHFSFAMALVDEEILNALVLLAKELRVIERYNRLLGGECMNTTEKRPVLHHRTRHASSRGDYGHEQQRFSEFAEAIRKGEIRTAAEKPFTNVIQIGIGGSNLGPRACYTALEGIATTKGYSVLPCHFISNVDIDDAASVLTRVSLDSSLFIIVSKSGTTQETLSNLTAVQEYARKQGISEKDLTRQMVAVTSKGSPLDNTNHFSRIFYIDDAIGGRFSVTSAVGGVLLSLAFGAEVFEAFLKGAGDMDTSAEHPDPFCNMALMSALIGIWERNIRGYSAQAIVPYSEALDLFPAHLQQLACESNGKSASIYNEPLSYPTGQILFGGSGTNAQHSFFQLLHQGTDVIPIQFIGLCESQRQKDFPHEGTVSQNKLIANMIAQMVALAIGNPSDEPYKVFPGNRPSTLVYAHQLTPEVLGALLSFYENVVMFQGFLWNINSFDQEGVELGKRLTQDILNQKSSAPPALKEFLSLFLELKQKK